MAHTSFRNGDPLAHPYSLDLNATRTLKPQTLAKVSLELDHICIVTPGPGTYTTLSEFGYQQMPMTPGANRYHKA